MRSTEGATHAWVEAYLPELGWVGFDPTNNVLADESHVRTAVGRDYADVPPTRGVFKGDAVERADGRGSRGAVGQTAAARSGDGIRGLVVRVAERAHRTPIKSPSEQQQQQQQVTRRLSLIVWL